MDIDWRLFWDMGGHGVFVWSAYGASALAVLAEAAWLWRRWRRAQAASHRGETSG